MTRTGIVCEFNPFHEGHGHLIEKVKAETGGSVVCVMSGCFVQRGEPAVMPPSGRAAAAVEAGAAAVFELPYPWSTASAPFFAEAAVYMLRSLGCDSIAFGSESCDTQALKAAASAPRVRADAGQGSAAAYPRMLPNDVLAVEYLRAIDNTGGGLKAITVKREGSHLSTEPGRDGVFASSAAIRETLMNGGSPHDVTKASRTFIESETAAGRCPATSDNLSQAALAFWRLCDPDAVSVCAECGGGVAGRLRKAALAARSFDEMIEIAATKKYTNARLRRAVWFGMTGVGYADLRSRPAYARLLAAGPDGRRILASGAGISIPVVARVRGIPDGEHAQKQFGFAVKAEALFCLSLPRTCPAGTFAKESALYLPGSGE